MLYLISYDISEDRRRQRVFEALKDFGRRVQYSVFECALEGDGLKQVKERIEFEIDPATDSCRIYRLCEGCAAQVEILGRGDRYTEAEYYIV